MKGSTLNLIMILSTSIVTLSSFFVKSKTPNRIWLNCSIWKTSNGITARAPSSGSPCAKFCRTMGKEMSSVVSSRTSAKKTLMSRDVSSTWNAISSVPALAPGMFGICMATTPLDQGTFYLLGSRGERKRNETKRSNYVLGRKRAFLPGKLESLQRTTLHFRQSAQ